jgi:hypothetical protein
VPRIIDLDVIAPIGVTVRKNGTDYHLPGDPPVSLWLSIIDANDQWAACTGPDANDALQLFHDRMLELFQLENPELEELPFGPAGMFAVLSGFYGNSLDEEPEPGPPGADEAASMTKTTRGRASSPAKRAPRKPATRSRSSR